MLKASVPCTTYSMIIKFQSSVDYITFCSAQYMEKCEQPLVSLKSLDRILTDFCFVFITRVLDVPEPVPVENLCH